MTLNLANIYKLLNAHKCTHKVRWRGVDTALWQCSRGQKCTSQGPAAQKSPSQQTILKSMSNLDMSF